MSTLTNANLVPVLIALITGGAGAGGIAAFLKLKPESNTAAVNQAKSAMEMMMSLNDQVHEELERVKSERDFLRTVCQEQEQTIKSLRDIIRGVALMEEE